MRQQRDLFPTVVLATERLQEHWGKAAASRAAVDARLDLMRYTVDVTSHVVFGHDLNTLGGAHSELQDHLSRIFHALNVRTFALFPYWRYLKLPRDRATERSLRAVQTLVSALIAETRRALDADPARAENPKTLLEAMIVTRDEENQSERLTDADIAGNVLTLLLAGEDTTSNTLSWMLHYMAHEPEIQLRLRQEAAEVFGGALVAPRYEDVAKLKYAVAVTQETLRMRSAAPILIVEAQGDVELGGIQLRAGSWVIGLTRYCGLLDENFAHAERFLPHRWLAAPGGATAHNGRAALAFGAGPRTCPGRSLALLECAMVASMIAQNFEVEPISGRDEVEEGFDFTMFPKGLRVRYLQR